MITKKNMRKIINKVFTLIILAVLCLGTLTAYGDEASVEDLTEVLQDNLEETGYDTGVYPEIIETEMFSEETVQEEEPLYAYDPTWMYDGIGWWYRYSDGSYPAGGWAAIDGAWYYFDGAGYMCTGWIWDDGWYYLRSDGTMATGWVWDGRNWYFMDGGGVMQADGWLWDGNHWYYLSGSGAMYTGWLWDGDWYYLKPDGSMASGWVWDGRNWYFMNGGGAMQSDGWLWDGNAWYYLSGSGAMYTGWLYYDGAWYFLKPDGAMAVGWISDGNQKYFLNSNGAMHTGWLWNDQHWYYFGPSGAMQTGWLFIGEDYYYLDKSGIMQTGWVQDGNDTYYMDDNGVMQTGWIQIGNDKFFLEDSGRLNLGKSILSTKEFSVALQTSSGTMVMTRTLKLEYEGDDVQMLQQKLVDLGYLSAVPKGYFGNLTYDALTAFQKDHGLKAPYGIADESTMKQLSVSSKKDTKTVPEYTISPLATTAYITDKNYDREQYVIKYIIPHHMAGKLTGANCSNYFVNNGLSNSANYCVGYDGDISACVPEEYGAWTSSWWAADEQGITIEVSDEANGSIIIPDKAIESLIRLCADLIRRNPTIGDKMVYDPNDRDIVIAAKQNKDPSQLENVRGNVLLHNWTSGNTTSCPEADMTEKMPIIANKVNELLANPNAKIDLSEFTAITERRKAEQKKAEEQANQN